MYLGVTLINPPEYASMYQVIDSRDGLRVISTHKTRKSAERKADRLDAEYGATRYVVRFSPIPATIKQVQV